MNARAPLFAALLLLAACASTEPAPAKHSPAPPIIEPRPPPPPGEAAESDSAAEPLLRLLLLRKYARMVDCGHDATVGELGCAFATDGSPRPLADERVLHVYLTDPPGLVLAASAWHPARMLERYADQQALVAECAFSERGRLGDVGLAATAGVPGWLYLGSLPVYSVSACDVAPHAALPRRLSAAHLLVMHDDSRRKPAKLSRRRAEAIERARRAARDAADSEVPFAELATLYSDEPGADRRGGFLGRFALGAMVPEFELVLLATPIGARSAAFETIFGFHILERRGAQ